MELNESKDLYKGIFWIKDLNNLDSMDNDKLIFVIDSDSDGNIVSDTAYEINAKSGTTYNHERTWKDYVPSNIKGNKKYNYYPRGRVEISNGRADIYLNLNICTDEVKNYLIRKFHLYKTNGINNVKMHPDGSEHYRCYLDS